MDLSRFTKAHKTEYEIALKEVKEGKKRSHWMWYIFPEISGLGESPTSVYYAVKDINEAVAFLNDEYLGGNLREICGALLNSDQTNAVHIFGQIDAMKLRSSMTLFDVASGQDNSTFYQVLVRFFNGEKDKTTLAILARS